jgi:Leucine-rich repeat (LRR) protein/V8-like Glu-specific endopeptidase
VSSGRASGRFSVFVFLALITVSCGPGPRRWQSTSRIIGGKEVPAGRWENVVALVEDGRIFCSGTLVHPRVVLTAGHCVEPDAPNAQPGQRYVDRVKVYRGTGADGGEVSATLEIVKAERNPSFHHHLLGEADSSYLVLKDPVTDVQITPILTDLGEIRSLLADNARTTLVGFGVRDISTDLYGRKFEVETKVLSHNSDEVRIGEIGADTCSGDSGGPAFGQLPDGEWRVYGITSRGQRECGAKPSNGGEFSPGIYGLMQDSVCWVTRASGIAIAPAMDCSEAETSYSDAELAKASFEQVCGDPKATPHQSQTVRAIKLALGSDQLSCQDAAGMLKQARELDLSRSFIADLSPLVGLDRLEKLSLRENRIRSLQPLLGLKSLKEVDLVWNDLAQGEAARLRESVPGALVRGERLQASNYTDTDFLRICRDPKSTPAQQDTVNAIKAMFSSFWNPSSTCEDANDALFRNDPLVLQDQRIVDVTPLAGLEHLSGLDLSGNEIEDVAPLATLSGLKTLNLSYNPVKDLSALDPLVAGGLKITHAVTPDGLTQLLTYKTCDGKPESPDDNRVFQASGLAARLSEARWSQKWRTCKLFTITALENTTEMNIAQGGISDIRIVGEFRNLVRLDAQANQISDVSSLAALARLKLLDLSGNRIQDASPLKTLTGLESLNLSGNPLADQACPLADPSRCKL